MELEQLIKSERDGLTSRVAATLAGDRYAAEDIVQEAFTRAWQSLPYGLEPRRQTAWLRRTSTNLAIDELRRRARRPVVGLEEADGGGPGFEAPEPDAAREALAELSAHERFVLLLRFQAGFAHADIARLLDCSEEAARKRVRRARTAFVDAYRAARAEKQPLVLLLVRDEPPAPYVGWLGDAGARVRQVSGRPSERELTLADGVVLTGAFRDVHSALYGESPRLLRGEPDLADDRLDLAVIQAAVALDLPTIGVCRGHQLLNIVSGGSLYQDVVLDGATCEQHGASRHTLRTHAGGSLRGLLGRSAEVHSDHHQAVRRLGRGLRVAATSPDGLIETIERTDRRFMLGLQWHPETERDRCGDAVAEALVEAAVARAA